MLRAEDRPSQGPVAHIRRGQGEGEVSIAEGRKVARLTDNILLQISRYLQPYLEEVVKERKEKEEWAKLA